MQSKVSPTLIGVFVLASLVLGLGAVFLFSNGSLAHPTRFILYFEGDVKGLQVGSPVNFRGVKVGQVESMSITYFQESREFRIPVIIGIEDSRVKVDGVMVTELEGVLELDELIQQGLRARLNLQSLVTGKLEIELDFQPDSPVRLVSANDRYPEIPTVQSGMEKLATAIEQIPVERITLRLSEILDNIDEMMAQGELKRLMDSFILITRRLDQVTQLLAQETPGLLENSTRTLAEAQTMLKEVTRTAAHTQTLIATTEKNLSKAFSSWDSTMASGDEAFSQVSGLATSADRVLSQDSELMSQMTLTLRELGSAARSIRIMSEYLERHPEALIRGKQ